jgi:hypothetical protein
MGMVTRTVLALLVFIVAVAADAQPRPGGGRGPSGGGGGGGGTSGGLIVKIQAEQLAQLMKDAGFPSKVIDNNGKIVQTVFWNDQTSAASSRKVVRRTAAAVTRSNYSQISARIRGRTRHGWMLGTARISMSALTS